MELNDKIAIFSKNFAVVKQAHDELVAAGATCGPQCEMFHKAFTPTNSKHNTSSRARALLFLHELGRDI